MFSALVLLVWVYAEAIFMLLAIQYFIPIFTPLTMLFTMIISVFVGLFLGDVIFIEDTHCACAECKPAFHAFLYNLFVIVGIICCLILVWVINWLLAML